MERLLTDQQVCDLFGIPTPRTVRTMRQQGLRAARIGKAYLYDPADVRAFIAARMQSAAPATHRTGPIDRPAPASARPDCVAQAQATSAKLRAIAKQRPADD